MVQKASVVAPKAKVDSRIAMLRKLVVEFGIKAFNPSPIWVAVAELFDVAMDADASFVSIVERNGGSWVIVADGDDSYSCTVDANSIPEGLAIADINDWRLAVVEASRDAKDYGIEKGMNRLRAYPILED